MRTIAKIILKTLLQVSRKKNLLLTHYSHVSPALKEVKHVAIIFSTYFHNKKLKNETRKLAKNATTGFLTF